MKTLLALGFLLMLQGSVRAPQQASSPCNRCDDADVMRDAINKPGVHGALADNSSESYPDANVYTIYVRKSWTCKNIAYIPHKASNPVDKPYGELSISCYGPLDEKATSLDPK